MSLNQSFESADGELNGSSTDGSPCHGVTPACIAPGKTIKLLTVPKGAATTATSTRPGPWTIIYDVVVGNSSEFPSPCNALWQKARLERHYPMVCPNKDTGVLDHGVSLTDIVMDPAYQVHLAPHGFTAELCKDAKAEAKHPVDKDLKELAQLDPYDPQSNPSGFPNRNDKGPLCCQVLYLYGGEAAQNSGCMTVCSVYVTHNGENAGKLSFGCPVEDDGNGKHCPGYRSMTEEDRSIGATAMVTGDKWLIYKLTKALAAAKDKTIEEKIVAQCNVILTHSTIVLGLIRFEARRMLLAETAEKRRSGMSQKRPAAKSDSGKKQQKLKF